MHDLPSGLGRLVSLRLVPVGARLGRVVASARGAVVAEPAVAAVAAALEASVEARVAEIGNLRTLVGVPSRTSAAFGAAATLGSA